MSATWCEIYRAFSDRYPSLSSVLNLMRDSPTEKLVDLCFREEEVKKKIAHQEPFDKNDLFFLLVEWHRMLDKNLIPTNVIKNGPLTRDNSKFVKYLESICSEVKKRYAIEEADNPELLLVSMAHDIHHIHHGLSGIGSVDVSNVSYVNRICPILLDRPIPFDECDVVHILIPIVPVPSIFTLEILSLLCEFLKQCFALGKHVSIELMWNPVAYERIVSEQFKDHLSFDKRLDIEAVKLFTEAKFMNFVNQLLLSSGILAERRELVSDLLDEIVIRSEDDVRREIHKEDTRYRSYQEIRYDRKSFHEKLLYGSARDFSPAPNRTGEGGRIDLISMYATLIAAAKARITSKEKHLFVLIGPLTYLLPLADVLDEYGKAEEKDEKANLRLMAYLPLSYEQSSRRIWPLYLSFFSQFQYNHLEPNRNFIESDCSAIARNCNQIMIILSLKRLDLDFLNIRVDELARLEYSSLLDFITRDVFGVVDKIIDRQLQFVF
jgi:hypothetical protein